jgi:hypothetical protein
MSLVNEEIDVQSTSSGRPAVLSWRGHVYRVRRVIGTWVDDRHDGHGEPRLVRVATESDHGHVTIIDLSQDPHRDSWTVRRLWE